MIGSDPTVEASVVVDASPAAVWQTLTAFDAYPEWNPLIRRVSGRPTEGHKLGVLLTQNGIPPTLIRPTVTRLVPERELSWRSAAPIPGSFEATHRFLLEPLTDGEQTRFTQTETFGGVAAGLVPRGLRTRIREGFVAMNEALAARVEREQDSSHRNR
ncbi:SRPBCC domain-containing protein [Halobaculum limi]|uniref:SRPBCC domain-containing protein n=1 Tax=Halobaculum limi TaxID=3031916 RepID=UPI002406E6AB|nr:SRPBCC domain-containing protein [Halobaculum sp. YSMS11]